jgi:hypothetical protein
MQEARAGGTVCGTARESNWKDTLNRFIEILGPALPSTELWPLANGSHSTSTTVLYTKWDPKRLD